MNKRTRILVSLGGVAALAVAVMAVRAQQGTTAAPRVPTIRNVAVVDIGYILENHLRFQNEQKALTEEEKQADQAAQDQQKAIRAMVEELKTLEPGSAAYTQLEDRIIQQQKAFEANVLKLRRDFLTRRMKLVYNTYQEIATEIAYYAQSNGIVMVFRFNGDKVDPNVPDDVNRYINQAIVFHDRNLDITPAILQRLNARAQTATSGNAPAAGYQRLPTPNYR